MILRDAIEKARKNDSAAQGVQRQWYQEYRDEAFRTREYAREILDPEHPAPETYFECAECGKTFGYEGSATRAMERHYEEEHDGF